MADRRATAARQISDAPWQRRRAERASMYKLGTSVSVKEEEGCAIEAIKRTGYGRKAMNTHKLPNSSPH